jgi:dihydrofolate reductase
MQLSRLESEEVIDAIALMGKSLWDGLGSIWAVFDRTMVVYWSRRPNALPAGRAKVDRFCLRQFIVSSVGLNLQHPHRHPRILAFRGRKGM